jgi:hypothetical protein
MSKAVTQIGDLMDLLRKQKIVSISPGKSACGSLAQRIRQGKGHQPTTPPPGLADFDGLMRRCNKFFGKSLRNEGLRRAYAAVAEYKGCLLQGVRRMTFAEFNAALDEAMGKRRYGPDPDRPILYWDEKPYRLTPKNWEFLKAVWGKSNVPYAIIGEEVWGDDTTRAGTIAQRIYRVNRQLTEHGIGLTFSSDGEHVSPLDDWPK